MATTTKVWLVTDDSGSSGFARAVTERALRQGDRVVVVSRNVGELSDLHSKYASQLLTLSSDVTDPDQTRGAFESALGRFGRVDIVFNNAGSCIIGEAEGVSEERGRALFESLFWGAVNVTKEAVKVFRDRNSPPGGRLLQVSSWATLKAIAGVAHYAAAKTALECFSEGLAIELDPSWNIKISIIQLAFFCVDSSWSTVVEPIHPAYGDSDLPSRTTRNFYPGSSAASGSDEGLEFARATHRLAHMDDPPFYLPVHQAAAGAAKARGEGLIQTAEQYASWSNDVYLHKN